jgi:NhaP-type Na+/H+ and K+/H+ antiporter
VARHVGGASKILPVTFLVIVVTVAVYGLTAVPVAGRLGVTRPARARPLLVGGDDWVIDLGRHQIRAEQALRRRRADLRAARRRYGQRRR